MKPTRRPLVLAALVLSMFMAAMEMTVVSTAMPTVVGDLGGIQLYAWVFTAYLVASTVMVPIFGKLADLFGRKPVLLFGISVFLVSSIACGFSTTMWQLVIFRALQGFGAGAMQPIVITVIGDIYSLEERAKIQGVIGAIWGFAGLVGPLLGGFIVKVLSWPWVFFINVPVGIASIVLLSFFLHESVEKKRHALDFAGAGTFTLAILLLLAGVSGGGLGAWPLLPAAALLVLFVFVEKRAAEPLLPIPLMRQPVIGFANVASALIGAAMMATVTYVPLYVQAILEGSPTDAGRAIAPMVIGWPISSTVAGRLIPRYGFRPLIRVGVVISSLSAIALAVMTGPTTPVFALQVVMFCFGAGLGSTSTALLLSVQTSVDWKQRGVATASNMFFRTIGGTLAVGALGGILSAMLAGVPGADPGAAAELLGPEHGRSLDPALLRTLSGALDQALHLSFWVVAALAALAVVVAVAFPADRKVAAQPEL
ncbi:MAG: MDR family MFS transporter [Myxococcaceae bacterium]